MHPVAPHIVAEVRFLTTAEGGRNGGIGTGYRPTHDMGHPDGILNDGKHDYLDREWVELGDVVFANITFLVPDYQFGRLHEGFGFKIQEGSKIVGHGVIRAVFDPQMRKL
jgi:translation elongation factor EF-Tu-like GTPase